MKQTIVTPWMQKAESFSSLDTEESLVGREASNECDTQGSLSNFALNMAVNAVERLH